MNLKNMTIALILALVYEVLLKLSHIFAPSLFNLSLVSGLTSVLSVIVGLIIILFLYFFYQREKSNQKIEWVLKSLIGCIVLHSILRFPFIETMIDFKVVRLGGELIGLIKSILLFGFLILFKREIPFTEKLLARATVFLTIMSGIRIIKSSLSLIDFTRFFISGLMTTYSPIFYYMMLILFLITHVSMIYFLYRYYQFKFIVKYTKV